MKAVTFYKIHSSIALLLFFFFSLPTNLNAQSTSTDSTFGYHYKMSVETPIYLCNILGTQLSDSIYEAPDNAIFTHVGNKTDSIIIRFWIWSSKNPQAIQTYNYLDAQQTQLCYFLMSQSDFQNKTKRRYNFRPQFSVGTAAVPFKIRTSPFRFTNDVGIGPVVGAKVRLSRYTDENFFNLLLGFGVSSVDLDSLSTNGNIRESSTITNPASLTISLGGVFEFSNVQVGMFVGRDYINNNQKIDWIYQGKTWISIGLGYALFTKTTSDRAGSSGTNTTAIGN